MKLASQNAYSDAINKDLENCVKVLTTLPTQSDEPSTSSNPGFAVPVTKMISLEDPTVIHILQHIHEMSLSSSNKNVNTSKKKKGKGLREKPDNMKDGEEIKKEITLPPKPSHETKTSAIDKNVNPTRERKGIPLKSAKHYETFYLASLAQSFAMNFRSVCGDTASCHGKYYFQQNRQ
ncbi:unnamed protein product [Albugo candida]|uniref:Uncharacterized protein n=1 Tax=Albugo candida TaxID=65357 RepID=A0A024GVY7_9STRA|nr:unnamed protein product [Albugo candida]|eukprot:CCI50704.1 unnamed protein product [Albugo candida]